MKKTILVLMMSLVSFAAYARSGDEKAEEKRGHIGFEMNATGNDMCNEFYPTLSRMVDMEHPEVAGSLFYFFWEGEPVYFFVRLAARDRTSSYLFELTDRERWLSGLKMVITDLTFDVVVAEKILGDKGEVYFPEWRPYDPLPEILEKCESEKCLVPQNMERYYNLGGIQIRNYPPYDLRKVAGKLYAGHVYKVELFSTEEFRKGIRPVPKDVSKHCRRVFAVVSPLSPRQRAIKYTHMASVIQARKYHVPGEVKEDVEAEEAAEELYKKALEEDETFVCARSGLGRLYYWTGRYEESIRMHESILPYRKGHEEGLKRIIEEVKAKMEKERKEVSK